MKLIALGGDARLLGALEAAKKAGWDTAYICKEEDIEAIPKNCDAVLLPWPHSFRDDLLCGTQIGKERVIKSMPACTLALFGGGVSAQELTKAQNAFDPSRDEAFLRANARLTAEGAIYRAMQRQGRALLGATVLITGFGRIAQELAVRLVAMGSFVIVCARNELQMRRAHELGAHPVPLSQASSACRQAEVVFSTVPAHVLGKSELDRIAPDALVIELASPPYGMNIEMARHMGVNVVLESGVPGRYAPMNAGAALFDVLERRAAQIAKQAERSGEHE
ncbi:MAG: NAD(P)-binding domain-containing protein [Clostridia bacterium]|nr:NAD(P)-binding domain-containing protein [Clostridia bacterium]